MTAANPAAAGSRSSPWTSCRTYNKDVPDLQDLRLAQRLRPVSRVVVPANGHDRGYRAQRLQDLGAADVSRVYDEVRTAQDLDRLGANQPVRVGDHPDPSCVPDHVPRSPRAPAGPGVLPRAGRQVGPHRRTPGQGLQTDADPVPQ